MCVQLRLSELSGAVVLDLGYRLILAGLALARGIHDHPGDLQAVQPAPDP